MNETVDLKAIKTKIYRTILEDGLLEIMMGIYLVLSGIYLNKTPLILNYLWLPIALILIEVIRRLYIYPRTGYVNISLPASEIIKILAAILIGGTILTALTALIANSMGHPAAGNWREIISYGLIFLLIIVFCFIAFRFHAPRWYMHGISIGLVFLMSKTLDLPKLVLGLGIWITLVGVIVFIRYLNQYPLEPNSTAGHETPSQTKDEEISEVSNAS